MSNRNLTDTTPAPPSGKVNVKFQLDSSTNPASVSAYMPVMTGTVGGAVPTPPNDATKFLDGTGVFDTVKDSDLSTSDVTDNNVSSTKHGFAPKSPADATKFLNGASTNAYAQVKDSDLSTSDVTDNNVSTSKHGFVPKLPNDVTLFLNGTGGFSAPTGPTSSTLTKGERGWLYNNGNGISQTGADNRGGGGSSWGNTTNAPSTAQQALSSSDPAMHELSIGAATAHTYAVGVQDGLSFGFLSVATLDFVEFGIKLVQTANFRCWIGISDLADGSDTTLFASDTPNANIVGFHYSAGVTSGHWRAVTQTDNTHQTPTDSGVAADTNYHTFRFVKSGSNILFYIDGSLVATNSSNLPAAATGLNIFIRLDNKNTANNVKLRHRHMQFTDK